MKRTEFLARLFAVAILLGLIGAVFVGRAISLQQAVEIHARLPESGGWSPDTIHAETGQPIHLHLTSDDVLHSFAIGQNDMPPVDVEPGKVTELTLTFNRPGKYTFYCTRWCGRNHWRMRGTIEVTGGEPDNPQPVSSPLYVTLGLDIDTGHRAAVTPENKPSAWRGQKLETSYLGPGYLAADYYKAHSPAQVYPDLRAVPALVSLNNNDIWDLVAYIWQSNTTPQGLTEGARLYAVNCAACHGENGAGDGVYADDLARELAGSQTMPGLSMAGRPANFTDPEQMLGASPAILQGKILRGGMGTGMPYWGPIFSEEQTWNIVGFLYTFQFEEVFHP